MATSKDINHLVINKLSDQEVYEKMVTKGLINDDELYLVEGNNSIADIEGLSEVLDGKADTSHTHDDRYYTETEINNKISSHNTSSSAHDDIRDLIADITTKLNNFLDVDDTSTDQLSEVLTLINNNKSALDSLALSKVNVSDIVDNLTTSSTTKVLSAKQGVAIKALIDALQTSLDDVADTKVDKVSGKSLSTNDYTTTEKNKLSGIASGAEVNQNAFSNVVVGSTTIAADSKTDSLTIAAGSGISVSGDATNDKVTITNSGVRSISTGTSNGTISVNTNGSSANVAVKGLGSAAYTASTAYDAAGMAQTKAEAALASAKEYTDSVASGKANNSHTHAISNITNLQDTLDGKASATHNHDAAYDTKGAAATVQGNLDVINDKLEEHADDTDIHVTTSNKTNWNAAHTHSQAAHARTDATKVADSTTNGNILINGMETNVYTHPSSGVTAGTYKSVTVNAQGHVTAGTNPTTLAGYGITDAESKGAASNALASAKEYTDSVASGKANTSHNHDSAYDKKGAADTALASAKTYADSAAATVKNDLLNGAGAAYDTLKELGDLIVDNKDAIDALEDIAAGKADQDHSHEIVDVSGLQSALDDKAAKSHGTHVSYSTTAPVMDGTASVGSAATVARSDHKHPTDTTRASKADFDNHLDNTTAHITSTERSNWNAAKTHADSAHAPSNAEKNQNAFSNVKVGSTTIAADSATDTLTLVAGTNVTITPDATNDKVTIAATDTVYTHPSYTSKSSGLYKITVDGTGHVSAATAVAKSDITGLGIPAQDTTYDEATASTNGLMTSAMVTKLNGIATGATANTGTITGVSANGTSVATSGVANIPAASTSAYGVTKLSSSTSSTSTTLAATASAVKAAYDLANGKQAAITGGATTITSSNLTASRALISNSSGKVAVSAVTSTELGYLDGVTSNVQTQLNAKAPLASPTFTGTATVAAGTDYTTKKVRNVLFGTSAPTSSTAWSNGDIFIVYTP